MVVQPLEGTGGLTGRFGMLGKDIITKGDAMTIQINPERGRAVAQRLHEAFATTGIHGQTEMPEDILPAGIERGSLAHLLFVTLTVSIDYQRDALALWQSARQTMEDPETAYLFVPAEIYATPFEKMVDDMQRYGLSKKTYNDAWYWRTIAITFLKKWKGDPRLFLADCNWDGPTILQRLKSDTHPEREQARADFPYLRGDKIGPLWVRMLRDNVGLDIRGLEQVPIPVDIHIARATLTTGVVRGHYTGALKPLFEKIRQAWFESVRGLRVDGREMIALDVDEPLWHLSRYGCTHRDKQTGRCPLLTRCEAGAFCIAGAVSVTGQHVILDT